MNLRELKKEWIKGFSLCWRILAIVIMVRIIFTVGLMTSIMVAGAIGVESLLLPFFITFGLIGVLIIPILVSAFSESVSLGILKPKE